MTNPIKGSYQLNDRVILFCPLHILFKIRLNVEGFLNRSFPNVLKSYAKNKIGCIVNDVITTSVLSDVLVKRGTFGLNPNFFDLDHVNGSVTKCAKSRQSYFDARLSLCHGDQNYNLIWTDIGPITKISIEIHSSNNKAEVVQGDTVTIKFDGFTKLITEVDYYRTYLCFDDQCQQWSDDLVFIGSKNFRNTKESNMFREYFALVYNRFSLHFSYVIMEQLNISTISGVLAINVFTHNQRKILCICSRNPHCKPVIGGGSQHLPGVDVYTYNMNNGKMIKRMPMFDGDPYITHLAASFSLIENHLVLTINDTNKDIMSHTWINFDNWNIEETIIYPQKKSTNISDIKLIGIHNNLSAIVVTKQKPDSGYDSDIYYF